LEAYLLKEALEAADVEVEWQARDFMPHVWQIFCESKVRTLQSDLFLEYHNLL